MCNTCNGNGTARNNDNCCCSCNGNSCNFQRICRDCNGNIVVRNSNCCGCGCNSCGCGCNGCGNGFWNLFGGNNRCCGCHHHCGCNNCGCCSDNFRNRDINVITFCGNRGSGASTAFATNGDDYYARQYGLNSRRDRSSCCCDND